MKKLSRILGVFVWCLWLTGLGSRGADSPEVERAQALKKAGKTLEAIAVLEPFVAANLQDMRAHHVLAWLYQGQGNQAKAVEHFRKVLELAPDSPEAKQDREALQRLGVAVTETPPKTEPGGGPTRPIEPAKPLSPEAEALRQLFEQDPAAAWEQTVQLSAPALTAGKLEGLLDLLRAATARSVREGTEHPEYFYHPLLEDLIDRALALAQPAGNWAAVGELHTLRAFFAWKLASGGCWPAGLRFLRAMEKADAAFAKAGKQNDLFQALREPWTARKAQLPDLLARRAQWRAEKLGPPWAPAIQAIEEAVGEARDAEAVGLMQKLVPELATPPNPDAYGYAAHCIAALLWLRQAESVLPAFRQVVGPKGDPSPEEAGHGVSFPLVLGFATWTTGFAWSGRNDLFRDTFYWALNGLDTDRQAPPYALVYFASKLRLYGREAEGEGLFRFWLEWTLSVPPESRYASMVAWSPVWSGSSPAERQTLVDLACQESLRRGDPQSLRQLIDGLHRVVKRAPAGQENAWAVETGMQLLETAIRYPDVESQSGGVAEAALLFEAGGRPDLAEQARALSASLTQGEPQALLQCALIAAQGAVAEERWADVETYLGSALSQAGLPPSPAMVDACLLLAYAQINQQKSEEATVWLGRARALLDQVELSPGERVSHLLALATFTADPAAKLALLEQAQQAAQAAGLDLLQEKVTEQGAQVALDAGDLAKARDALLQLVQQQEAQRDQLAFDPLLRQQWFADRLSPYRRLLRVAALQQDGLLALSCAERMRSRVLIDQLAWRKVDLAVGERLPPELRQRLTSLREQRRQVYRLLQQGMGFGGSEEGEDNRGAYLPLRGAYLPLRGAYLPLRGPLEGAGKFAPEDTARLKDLLAALAQEETALEGAIREAVPAYQRASAVRFPEAAEQVAALQQDPALVVLEYTFCDQGLVAVGLRGGQPPQVVLLPESREALLERLGKFREWLMDPEKPVDTEAKALYQTLVGPFEKLLAGAQRLWVVADGALQLIPVGALQGPDGKYLAEGLAISYAPSLALALTDRGEREKAERSGLILAAPETGAWPEPEGGKRGAYLPIRGAYLPLRGAYLPLRGEDGVSTLLTAMAAVPLLGAKAEGEAVAKRLAGSVLVTGKEATKARLLQEGSTCDVLHLATHGFADPEAPDFSGVLLAGEGKEPYAVLTAQEVYLWSLRARLVTLSACQTGLGQEVEGEGLLGLTRSFLYAGAWTVVCSLWPVSDASTAQLMQVIYGAWEGGKPVEGALQLAQQVLLNNEKTRHPFYWAGFIVMRGPK